MEKERKIKVLSLFAMIVAVLGLTVAFATMSATLKINGTATLDAASWDIHFENMSCAAIVSCGTPKLDGTKITNLQAVITKPGEGAGIFVDIVNGGTIDAKISSVEVSKLCTLNSSVEACDWDNDGSVTQKDIDKVNQNVSLTIFYLLGPDNVIKPGDILKAGESRKMIVYFVYGKMENGVMIEGTELPSRDLKFNPVDIKINYVQA